MPLRNWLALAEEGRRRNIPEPDPSALAHKAFQAKIAAATRATRSRTSSPPSSGSFPRPPKTASGDRPGALEQAYKSDPAAAYRWRRPISAGARPQLWADAVAKCWKPKRPKTRPRRRAGVEGRGGTARAAQLATKLLNTGLDPAPQNLGSLRLGEVRAIAQAYRKSSRTLRRH